MYRWLSQLWDSILLLEGSLKTCTISAIPGSEVSTIGFPIKHDQRRGLFWFLFFKTKPLSPSQLCFLMTSHHIISNISDRHKTKHTQYTSNLSFIATSENPYETLTTMVDGAPRHWFPSRILCWVATLATVARADSVELFDESGRWGRGSLERRRHEHGTRCMGNPHQIEVSG